MAENELDPDPDLDLDLDGMDADQLRAEVRRLRHGVRAHRDSSRHDLCWFHPQLWELLPETARAGIEVPEWPQFLRGCVAFRQSLETELSNAPRVSVEFDEAPPRRNSDRPPSGSSDRAVAARTDETTAPPGPMRR